eukprot:5372533-Pyramimonas_sp.AAC.1
MSERRSEASGTIARPRAQHFQRAHVEKGRDDGFPPRRRDQEETRHEGARRAGEIREARESTEVCRTNAKCSAKQSKGRR